MSEALLAFVTTFALITAAELPDKTTVATLVLTSRYRSAPVLTGVLIAFAAQTVIAVAFGSVLTLLPERLVSGVVGVLFAIGAVMLLRAGFRCPAADDERDAMRAGPAPVSFPRSAAAAFTVLFVAEWGDASQLATAGFAARYAQPLAVGLGAFAALTCVAALAVFIGGKIRDSIRPHLLQRAAGFVFTGFAAFALGGAFLG